MTKIIILASFLLSALFGGYLIFKTSQAPKPISQAMLADFDTKKKFATGEVAAFIYNKQPLELPVLNFMSPDNQPMTLDAFKGKTILVNIWATWCGPCRHEMPTLDALQAKLGSDKFEVVTINVDRKSADGAAAFFSEIGIKNLKLYADPTTKVMKSLRARGLPLTVLINKQGMAVGRLIGPAEWNSPDAVNLIKAELN